jgi:hypothetical protein
VDKVAVLILLYKTHECSLIVCAHINSKKDCYFSRLKINHIYTLAICAFITLGINKKILKS